MKNDVKTFELFLNSPCESNVEFVKTLLPKLKFYNAKICSVHPCTSEFEGVSFFGRYERRFYDSLENYKKLFDICNLLGCQRIIFHGARTRYKFPNDLYFERFNLLCEKALEQDVFICHENVVDFYSGDLSFMKKLLAALPNTKTVLDIKQCIRASINPFSMLDTMKNNLSHIHLSDNNQYKDCMIPGTGTFDFTEFFKIVKKYNKADKIIIELYRNNFDNVNDLLKSKEYIDNILSKL